MSSILIAAYDGFLGTRIAARFLASGNHVVLLTDEIGFASPEELFSSVEKAVQNGSSELDATAIHELLKAQFNLAFWRRKGRDRGLKAIQDLTHVEEVWLLDGMDSSDILNTDTPSDLIRDCMALLAGSQARVFNYVDSVYSHHGETGADRHALRRQELASQCEGLGIRYRMFHVSSIVGEGHLRAGSGAGDIRQLLAALDDVIAEVQERLPEYFDFQSLRLLAEPDAAINLIRVDHAVNVLLQLAQQEGTLDSEFHVGSPKHTPVKNLCRMLGKIYGTGFSIAAERQQLNAIDSLLEQRFAALGKTFRSTDVSAFREAAERAGVDFEALAIDDSSQQKLFTSVRQKQKADRAARNQRAASLLANIAPRSIDRNGDKLNYYVIGTKGDFILVLNALGQMLDFWHRLIDQLARHYRVVIWETRGLEAGQDSLRMSDHLDDIESILLEEQATACYLIAWCTGPQLASEFYLRHPEMVMGMAYLNTVYKVAGRLDLDTTYGINLEKLCRLLDTHPEMTPSVMKSLSAPPASNINLMDETDSGNAARQVLALTNVHLRSLVLAPFRTVQRTQNYARQIVDLVDTPTAAKAPRVESPILMMGCEYDQVALAAKSREVARLYPNCRHVELPGATHYSIYDRTELVSAMLQRFFQDPSSVASAQPILASTSL
jgi:pimeloyl-ACP methyl ester carboxylesterase/nucleoside-diphosphate-sugar epimerase